MCPNHAEQVEIRVHRAAKGQRASDVVPWQAKLDSSRPDWSVEASSCSSEMPATSEMDRLAGMKSQMSWLNARHNAVRTPHFPGI